MQSRKFRFSLLAILVLFSLSMVTSALAGGLMIFKETVPYDLELWSCGDFVVLNPGEATHHAKITFDESGVTHINVQSTYDGILKNSEDPNKFLIEKGNHTWNFLFEDNISTNVLNAGGSWRVLNSKGALVWLNSGVTKFTGFTIDPYTFEISWGTPYMEKGHLSTWEDMMTTICAALE